MDFDNTIDDLNKELQRLTLQRDEVDARIKQIQNLVPPILEVKHQLSSRFEDIKLRRSKRNFSNSFEFIPLYF